MKTLLMIVAFMPCIAFAHGLRPAPRVTHIPVAHRVHRPMPPPPPRHHYHHSAWGRGGCNFWPGFTGALVGSTLLRTLPPPPVVAVNPVWIPPVYESRPVYDVYGRIIRYEQVVVRAGYWQY